MLLNLLLSKVKFLRNLGLVNETLKSVCKDTANNGIPVVITTRVMHLMAKGMDRAPINGVMERYMKETISIMNDKVKAKRDIHQEIPT